jgi:hypothetical protein
VIATILSWLAGRGLGTIAEELGRAYRARLDATNDAERIAAERDIAQLEARQRVLIAEQGNWLTRWIRPAFALPFVIYNFKILVWDKTLEWGVTDPLSSEFWQLQMIVFGAYFITRPLDRR